MNSTDHVYSFILYIIVLFYYPRLYQHNRIDNKSLRKQHTDFCQPIYANMQFEQLRKSKCENVGGWA